MKHSVRAPPLPGTASASAFHGIAIINHKRGRLMTKSLFTFGLLVVLLLGLDVGSSQAAKCQDILDNNLYRCHVNFEGGATEHPCVQVVSPGVQSQKFDLVTEGLNFGCTCKATGPVDDPDFSASNEFFCVHP